MSAHRLTWLLMGLAFVLVACLGGRGRAPAAPPDDQNTVLFFDHDRVKAGFAKGGVLLKRDNYQVHTSFRDQGGKPEVHQADTDVFYIVEGKGTLVLGGRVEGGRETRPGETLGESITGGEARPVAVGDIIVIPRTIPHWFKEVTPPFRYLTIKVREG